MKSHVFVLIVVAACLAAGTVQVQADTSAALADTVKRTDGAMAMLRAKFKTDLVEQDISEMAICITEDGIFLTMGLTPDSATADLTDVQLVFPGAEGKSVPAKLLGIDPRNNAAFFQATGGGKFKAIQFAKTASLKPGQLVTSAGLTNPEYGYAPLYAVAYVSTVLRTPTLLAVVTGGTLTSAGSPVFNEAGVAVGLVGRGQLYRAYETMTQTGPMRVMMRQTDECSTFIPCDEFVYSFAFPAGAWKRRVAWTGIKELGAVSAAIRIESGLKGPGAVVGTVFAGQPADVAGLKTGDIITAVNGKPVEELVTPELTARNVWTELVKLTPGKDQAVKLDVIRGKGVAVPVTVPLEEYPLRPSEAPRLVDKERLGMAVREQLLLDKLYRPENSPLPPGLVVIIVAKNKPAYNASLAPEDIIMKIDGEDVRTIAGFKAILDKTASSDKPIMMEINQKGEKKTVTVLPGKGR
ncbi:MAG: PDZ domain-containing protein [Planctomycetota bacterium]|nr:PDZ domain-containing protein [Planctomycetota bacterium]